MQRRTIIGMAIIAVLALSAIASAGASAAEPNVTLLGTETFPVTFSGTSGKGVLETVAGTTVKCEKDKSSGSITSATAGTSKITFEECKSSGFACNTTGQGSGIIVSEGTTKLVYDALTTLGVALLMTVKETVFECTAFVKVKVKGTILILINPINKETTAFELIVKQSKGVPADNKYWEGGVEKKPKLESSIDGGAFEESADESAENKITTSKMMTVNG